MNKRQKSIFLNFIFVIAVTFFFVAVMMNVRDGINKSEAIREMGLLAEKVLEYRREHGSLPSESYVISQVRALRFMRLGELKYRAQWIGMDAPDETILAYAYRHYHFLAGEGYVVMRLDGEVEWITKATFEELLGRQQSEAELELLRSGRGL